MTQEDRLLELTKLKEELAAAKEEVRKAKLAKDEFLTNIGHEIRTPLNGILGMSDLLLQSELVPQQQEYVAMIYESASLLLTILTELIDYSEAAADKLIFDTRLFQPRQIMHTMHALLQSEAAAKALELAFHVDENVPEQLVGDPVRLQQVILNLAANAIKFTSQGNITVSMKAVDIQSNCLWLRVTVADTGIGIASEDCEKLFAPFVQADGSSTRQFGGTGMGLALCRKFIEKMGGKIGVASELGKGSSFWFVAPFGIEAVNLFAFDSLGHTTCLLQDRAVELGQIEALLTLESSGAENFVYELITIYLQETPTSFSDLAVALQQENSKEFIILLHNLKSSSTSLGARRFSRLLQQMEQWANQGNFAECRQHFAALESEFQQVYKELEDLVSNKQSVQLPAKENET